MDREYAQMSTGAAYEGRIETADRPANALEAVTHQLASLENRLLSIASLAVSTADRVFGGAVPINSASAKGTGNKESVSIPAIMTRIERLHNLAGDINQSVDRLASL